MGRILWYALRANDHFLYKTLLAGVREIGLLEATTGLGSCISYSGGV